MAVREEGLLKIIKVWKPGGTVKVDFGFKVKRRIQHDGREAYWIWGAARLFPSV